MQGVCEQKYIIHNDSFIFVRVRNVLVPPPPPEHHLIPEPALNS